MELYNGTNFDPNGKKSLKQRIMRRIYMLFLLRNTAPLAFDCVVIVIAAFVATLFVSFKDVIANFSLASGGAGISNYSLTAFSETELETKLLLLLLGVVGFLGMRDLKRAWRAFRTVRDSTKAKTE
ncbi:MAG: hypothetical protein Q7R88_02830 [bacterium]|nr:hypothetical protein [bacterium]